MFLSAVGSTLAPRFIAGDAMAGILITEDLGTDPSLLDLLLGDDEPAARQGLLAFARGLGTLHAQTAGNAPAYAERCAPLGPADLDAADAAVRFDVMEHWVRVQDAVARLQLPRPRRADHDVAEVVRTFTAPGPYLALSSGDPSPARCLPLGAKACLKRYARVCRKQLRRLRCTQYSRTTTNHSRRQLSHLPNGPHPESMF